AGGSLFEVQAESFALEDAGVFGEEAEEDADEEAFEGMAGVAAGFEGVVQMAHDFDGFEIDRLLFDEFVLLVAGDEGEFVDVIVKVSEREFDGTDAAIVKKREISLVFGLEVMQGDAGEVGDKDV